MKPLTKTLPRPTCVESLLSLMEGCLLEEEQDIAIRMIDVYEIGRMAPYRRLKIRYVVARIIQCLVSQMQFAVSYLWNADQIH